MNQTIEPQQTADGKKVVRMLPYLCMVLYFASYITRINYGAVISEIVRAEGLAKDVVSLAVTGLFVTYGVGQLISGFLGDRIAPKYLITGGLVLASAMNFLLPLNANPYYMLVIWCINGLGQAFMWPPIVKLLSGYLNDKEYSRATVIVSWGSSGGTIAIYLIAPLMISLAGWRSVFYLCAALGLAAAVLCFGSVSAVERKAGKPSDSVKSVNKEAVSAEKKSGMRPFIPILAFIFIAIALQGTLRDGVTTWMPSYIGETFQLGTSISILTGVILPIFSIITFALVRTVFEKWVRSELRLSAYQFVLAALSAGLLAAFSGASPVLSVACSTLIVGCMHGINLLLICMVPGRFKAYGNISTVSGVLNFATYVGSALSTYGFARLSEIIGWQGTIVIWCVVAALGAVICFCVSPFWKFGEPMRRKNK